MTFFQNIKRHKPSHPSFFFFFRHISLHIKVYKHTYVPGFVDTFRIMCLQKEATCFSFTHYIHQTTLVFESLFFTNDGTETTSVFFF